MRIIAGSKRGMKLSSPSTQDSRPILDRIKESLFSVLYGYDLPKDKVVADIFSGVGSLGLEALSRGAKFVVFVDKDRDIISILKKNIARAGFEEKSKVVHSNAFKIGAPVNFDGLKYDLIFVDPPYATTRDIGEKSLLAGMMKILPEQMAEGAIVVVRTHKAMELLDCYGQLKIIERRKWGNMAITIFGQKTDDK